MRYSKKPAELTTEQAVLFYASKMQYFDDMINDPYLMSAECSYIKYVYDEKFINGRAKEDDSEKTCNQRIYAGENIVRCAGCESNAHDYKEKRKLKQNFNLAQKALIKFSKKLLEENNILYTKEVKK